MTSEHEAQSPPRWRLALVGSIVAVTARWILTAIDLEPGSLTAVVLGGIAFALVGVALAWTILRSVPAARPYEKRVLICTTVGGFVFGLLSEDRTTFFWGVTALVLSLSVAVRPLERSWRTFLFVFAGWMAGVIPLAMIQILFLLAGATPDQLLIGRAAFEILSYGVIFYFVNAALLLAFPRHSPD